MNSDARETDDRRDGLLRPLFFHIGDNHHLDRAAWIDRMMSGFTGNDQVAQISNRSAVPG